MTQDASVRGVHDGQPVFRRGPDPAAARLTVLLIHGRGGSAASMLGLAEEIGGADIAYIAPQARDSTWYPHSFLAPIDENQPHLTSALQIVSRLVDEVSRQDGGSRRLALLGFSQGACLALEFAVRHPRPYVAVAGLSGGLIGPPGTPRKYQGSLAGTSVFLGCSDVDAHIPLARVHETTEVFRRLGASVDERIYRGMDHTVNEDEIKAVQKLFGLT